MPADQVEEGSMVMTGPVHSTPEQSAAVGRQARASVPRSAHADLPPDGQRPDPVALLDSQAESREPGLVPIRHGRMASSPFAFFRGAALGMAADLARTPVSGITVQACGDAHLLNFGLYSSPERRLVFDVNDFDETLPGPWEWDVKRLAASIAVAGRERGFSTQEREGAVLGTVGRYRLAMREFAGMRTLDVWYAKLEADEIVRQLQTIARSADQKRRVRRGEREIAKAAARTNLQAAEKLTQLVDGRPQFVRQPPVLERLVDLLPDDQRHRLEHGLADLVASYAESLLPERRALLGRFQVVDMARKVVGVGSVGTRCWILLLVGRDAQDPLILQAKEAQPSVLERFLGPSGHPNSGERVVAGQRLMQASSDIFLGWDRTTGIDGNQRDFYVRQLRDGKGSFDITRMVPDGLTAYGRFCGWTLARAHARSGDRIALAAYLGSSDAFDRAIVRFAETYADLTERDHAALLRAIKEGRVPAQAGV
ncbi:MAG: DUF2252 domain-containing protein [Mycobacteriales bacterium]